VSLISNEYGSIARGDLKGGWQFDPDTPFTILINLWRTYEKVGLDQNDEASTASTTPSNTSPSS